MAIPLSKWNQAIVYPSVAWANKPFTMAVAPFLGVVPPALRQYAGKGNGLTEAWKVMKARGATSGGNARTQKSYAKSGKRPAQTLNSRLGVR